MSAVTYTTHVGQVTDHWYTNILLEDANRSQDIRLFPTTAATSANHARHHGPHCGETGGKIRPGLENAPSDFKYNTKTPRDRSTFLPNSATPHSTRVSCITGTARRLVEIRTKRSVSQSSSHSIAHPPACRRCRQPYEEERAILLLLRLGFNPACTVLWYAYISRG